MIFFDSMIIDLCETPRQQLKVLLGGVECPPLVPSSSGKQNPQSPHSVFLVCKSLRLYEFQPLIFADPVIIIYGRNCQHSVSSVRIFSRNEFFQTNLVGRFGATRR